MKLLTTFLTVCGFFLYACNAQYLEYIDGYNLYFNKLNDGQVMPEPDEIIKQDTVLTFAWERGDSTTGGYVSPYASTLYTLIWVENTLGLWNGDTTSTSQQVSFINGIYEITVTEVDTLQNQSPYSDPLFIEFRGILARIPINLQIIR